AVQALWQECIDLTVGLGMGGDGYLFGDFSIADAFFAPVVMRFQGYSVPTTALTQRYMQRILATPAVAAWMQAGQAEKVVLADEEVGVQGEVL
ncbi:MAG: hypothetical protein QF872_06575, partial [Gammaproteobacteria bacterium]|nr:hypothetical protein [Gammaproteobacteria bacterium]